jgi:putative Ca2+/H+ antiporter (TMEM165/GDT1 family)
LAPRAPAVFIGRFAANRLPMRAIRLAAAGAFAVLGAWILVSKG